MTLYTDNINNDIKKFATGYTGGLPSDNYQNNYNRGDVDLKFLLQITSLTNKVDDKIKELYLQAHYTNDVKLKIRFSKILYVELSTFYWNKQTMKIYKYFGNDKDITIDMSNPNYLGIRNKNDNPVKITIKPR